MHPRQREGLVVLKKMIKTYCINSIKLGETQEASIDAQRQKYSVDHTVLALEKD